MAHNYLDSVMPAQSHFAQVPQTTIERSTFDRSHGSKTTMNGNYLVPIYCDDVLPGDTHRIRATTLARLATPIVPIMDNMFADVFFFFVPNRLVWNNWERFNGAQDDPGDSTDFVIPSLPFSNFAVGSLQDQFGLMTGITSTAVQAPVSTLPFRGYNLIYNEWFRDQNLINSVPVIKDDGGTDAWSNYVLLKRAKRPDYFTSCLPWPQKGPAVTLPLGTSAPVRTSPTALLSGAQNPLLMKISSSGSYPGSTQLSGVAATNGQFIGTTSGGTGNGNSLYPANLYADLNEATSATINAIREAFQIQKLFERDARGGTRYVEIIKAHFQTVSPDFRLQRPELLHRSSTRVNINPVPQTSSTDSTTPQGNLAAYGTFSHVDGGFTHSFVEHGYIIGLLMIRADQTYQRGLLRHWSRRTRFDFYWPAFAHLGEQAVLNKEIFIQNTAADNQPFGYNEIWAEYRYKPSEIKGYFRSSVAETLDIWHLSEKFTTLPTLSQTFIESNAPFDRVIAVDAPYPQFLVDMRFDVKSTRPMPVFSVPGFIDRF